MVAGFEQLLNYMAQADFFTGVLPFLLSYIVIFLGVQRLPIIEDSDQIDARKYSALISIILAFFVANFLVQNPVYQSFFSEYIGRIVIGMVGILGFMVLVGLLGWGMTDIRAPFMGLIVVLLAVVAFGISGGVSAFIPNTTIPFLEMNLQGLFDSGLIWLLIIGAVLYWVTKEPSSSDKDANYWFGLNPGSSGNGEGENP